MKVTGCNVEQSGWGGGTLVQVGGERNATTVGFRVIMHIGCVAADNYANKGGGALINAMPLELWAIQVDYNRSRTQCLMTGISHIW